MINQPIKDNWLKILDFNSKIDLRDDSKLKEVEIRIPLTPIKINAYILYHFFKVLYPKFINDQQNILDMIISDDGKELNALYLYETQKAGIHESIEKIPLNLVKYQHKYLKDFDKIFDKVQGDLIKKKQVRISSIRLFKQSAIDILNEYCVDIEEVPINSFLERFLDLIQKLIEQDLFLIYPEPIIYKFLKELIYFLKDIRLKNLFSFIYDSLPKFNISFLVNSEDLNLILHLQKKSYNFDESYLRINLMTPNDLKIDIDNLNVKEALDLIQEKLKVEKLYYFKQNNIISLLSDLFELIIPPKKQNLEFIIQKLLFGYRSFENDWFMIPRPIIYNHLVRFILRLFGLNLNLKKLSHWAIPDLIFNFLDSYFGLNSKVLFILTDISKHKKLNLKKIEYLKAASEIAFLIEIENSTLVKLLPIQKREIFSDASNDSLDSLRLKFTETFDFLSAVITIDKSLIRSLVENFIFKHSKLALFSKLRVLKMIKKKHYFDMYPEFPPYKLIKKKRVFSLLKLYTPILIDKHEF